MDKIIQHIQHQLTAQLYPGASLAIFQNGEWQEWYLGECGDGRPTQPGLVYDLASVSKVVGVATVFIQLLAAGVIDLDQALKVYYPEVADGTLTIRQLLTHTSGIDPYIPNRDQLAAPELREAINHIKVTEHKSFLYTDVNFLLLGFMLEELLGQTLDTIFHTRVFMPLGMTATRFGADQTAVPTIKGQTAGLVHDPKARVLGPHAGSAGLFSTLDDLKRFCDHYLTTDFGLDLSFNYGSLDKPRSLGWNLDGNWLDHTGYTGPFIMVNRVQRQAVVFLTNRTYAYDDRPLWIAKRRELRQTIRQTLAEINHPY